MYLYNWWYVLCSYSFVLLLNKFHMIKTLFQIINLLDPLELPTILPKTRVVPKCLLLKEGQTVFLTGLARIDLLKVGVVFLAQQFIC